MIILKFISQPVSLAKSQSYFIVLDSSLLNRNSGGMINGTTATDQFISAGKVVHGLPSGMEYFLS